MKIKLTYLVLFILFFSSVSSYAQTFMGHEPVAFLDKNKKEVKKVEAFCFYKLEFADDSYWKVEIRDKNDRLFSEQWYKSSKMKTILMNKIYYSNGQLHIYGKRIKKKWYFNSFFENGAIKRIEFGDDGAWKKGLCFDQDGKELPFLPFEIKAQFPGGDGELNRYIIDRLVILKGKPEVLKTKVYFHVNTDGFVSDPIVKPSTGNKDYDDYIKTIFLKMPRWKPAMQDYEKVRGAYAKAIRF